MRRQSAGGLPAAVHGGRRRFECRRISSGRILSAGPKRCRALPFRQISDCLIRWDLAEGCSGTRGNTMLHLQRKVVGIVNGLELSLRPSGYRPAGPSSIIFAL